MIATKMKKSFSAQGLTEKPFCTILKIDGGITA